jgi:hypothetical protein
MPLDKVQASPREEDWGLNKVKYWEYKFCWLPQTCFLSGKQLWGKCAYTGDRYIHGPGEPVIDVYWIGKEAFTVWQLTK